MSEPTGWQEAWDSLHKSPRMSRILQWDGRPFKAPPQVFHQEYMCIPFSEEDDDRHRELRRLAASYAPTCEAYDATVCTGGFDSRGGAIPAGFEELILIERNSARVTTDLCEQARRLGFKARDLTDEIRNARRRSRR